MDDDQVRMFSWSKPNNFSQGSSSMNSTIGSVSGGLSPDEVRAWNPYYSNRLSNEMKAWNPFSNANPGAVDSNRLSDEMKAWNPYYNATPNAGNPFVFTAGGGGAARKIEETPFVPERGFYQPSTEETWEAYQALATLIQAQARANLPQVVLYGVADEVLSVLKSAILQSPREKKAEIERIMEPMPDHLFNQLVDIALLITDYYVKSPVSKTDDRVALFVPEKDFYQPKSEVTCTAYNLLLQVVKDQLQFPQPQIVECVLAHEVLMILKNRNLENAKKKEMIEVSFLDQMSFDTFETLLFAADLITDFHDSTYNSGAPAFGGNEYVNSQNTTRLSRMSLPPGFDFGSVEDGTDSDQMDVEESSDEDAKLVYSNEEESYPTSEDRIACGIGQESSITAGVRELWLSSPKLGARYVYSSDEESGITTGVGELSVQSPKLEFSSEDELMYLDDDKARGSDKEDEDGWVQIEYDENFI